MAFGFGKLIEELKKDPKKIVFTEGTDPRILEASSRLLASTFLEPILVGDEKEIFEVASEVGFNIRGAKIVNPETYDRMDEMIDTLYELRRAKGMTKEEAEKAALENPQSAKWMEGFTVAKVIVVPGKMINVVLKK